ncbi:MAG TPA: DNA recombination/repair protein RecA, partial [Bdellovibrionota bacterium]|nr:DNA recombination/repair protein RecA [Bdellovibrionota bacterium]
TTPGGRALKFYSSVRLDIRRIAAIKDGEQVVGNRTRVKVVKNKMAPPFREVEFDIMYGLGISQEGDLLDLASNLNVIEKSGTWYTYKDERIGQGRDNAKNYLKERPQMMATIREEVLKKSGVTFGMKPANTQSAAGATAAGPAQVATPATAPQGARAAAEAAAAAKAKAHQAAASKNGAAKHK